jgi:hypothetical protein
MPARMRSILLNKTENWPTVFRYANRPEDIWPKLVQAVP